MMQLTYIPIGLNFFRLRLYQFVVAEHLWYYDFFQVHVVSVPQFYEFSPEAEKFLLNVSDLNSLYFPVGSRASCYIQRSTYQFFGYGYEFLVVKSVFSVLHLRAFSVNDDKSYVTASEFTIFFKNHL